MTTVDVKNESYDALKRLADARGSSIETLVEKAISDLLLREASSPEEWLRRWSEVQADIQSRLPADISEEEIEADIDAAIAEVRAERRARSR